MTYGKNTSNSTDEDKKMIFTQMENLKRQYTTEYIEQDGFTFQAGNYETGNIDSLIKGFFDDIMLQFESTRRSRANDAYKSSLSFF